METSPRRILVVEDSQPFRNFICSTLGKRPDLQIIGEALDGLEAVHRAQKLQPSATDWLHPTRTPKQGNTVAMYINGGKYEELRPIFDRLATGADRSLVDDLRDMPFGTYGHLADKYGVHWFFQGEKNV